MSLTTVFDGIAKPRPTEPDWELELEEEVE
jgi:hypothetical protein